METSTGSAGICQEVVGRQSSVASRPSSGSAVVVMERSRRHEAQLASGSRRQGAQSSSGSAIIVSKQSSGSAVRKRIVLVGHMFEAETEQLGMSSDRISIMDCMGVFLRRSMPKTKTQNRPGYSL